jgi:hypothetical protein
MGKVMLVYVPYDSGKASERYGRGPLVAREAGLTTHYYFAGARERANREEQRSAMNCELAVRHYIQ